MSNPVRFLFLLFLAWSGTIAALAQAPPQIPVAKITITNIGPQVASESLVRANIRVREGEPYVRAAVDDDVRNLMKTGYFLNVRVTDEVTANGINLTYILLGKPKITDITITGNKKFSDRRLEKKLTTKVGDPLDERKLFTDAEEIKKLYQKSGYSQTEVKYIPSTDESHGSRQRYVRSHGNAQGPDPRRLFRRRERVPAEKTAQGDQDAPALDVFVADRQRRSEKGRDGRRSRAPRRILSQ